MNDQTKMEEALEIAVELYWTDLQDGLDDDERDDSEIYDLVTTAFRTGWLDPRIHECDETTLLGCHFTVDGNQIKGLRYCYSWQKCSRPRATFPVIREMSNGDWSQTGWAGLTYEEILLKLFCEGT